MLYTIYKDKLDAISCPLRDAELAESYQLASQQLVRELNTALKALPFYQTELSLLLQSSNYNAKLLRETSVSDLLLEHDNDLEYDLAIYPLKYMQKRRLWQSQIQIVTRSPDNNNIIYKPSPFAGDVLDDYLRHLKKIALKLNNPASRNQLALLAENYQTENQQLFDDYKSRYLASVRAKVTDLLATQLEEVNEHALAEAVRSFTINIDEVQTRYQAIAKHHQAEMLRQNVEHALNNPGINASIPKHRLFSTASIPAANKPEKAIETGDPSTPTIYEANALFAIYNKVILDEYYFYPKRMSNWDKLRAGVRGAIAIITLLTTVGSLLCIVGGILFPPALPILSPIAFYLGVVGFVGFLATLDDLYDLARCAFHKRAPSSEHLASGVLLPIFITCTSIVTTIINLSGISQIVSWAVLKTSTILSNYVLSAIGILSDIHFSYKHATNMRRRAKAVMTKTQLNNHRVLPINEALQLINKEDKLDKRWTRYKIQDVSKDEAERALILRHTVKEEFQKAISQEFNEPLAPLTCTKSTRLCFLFRKEEQQKHDYFTSRKSASAKQNAHFYLAIHSYRDTLARLIHGNQFTTSPHKSGLYKGIETAVFNYCSVYTPSNATVEERLNRVDAIIQKCKQWTKQHSPFFTSRRQPIVEEILRIAKLEKNILIYIKNNHSRSPAEIQAPSGENAQPMALLLCKNR